MLNNPHIKKYTVLNSNDTIKEQYTREPNDSDSSVVKDKQGIVSLPTFKGEWRKTPKEELDALNKEILEKRKIKREPRLKEMSEREQKENARRKALEEQLKLLNEELERRKKEEANGSR